MCTAPFFFCCGYNTCKRHWSTRQFQRSGALYILVADQCQTDASKTHSPRVCFSNLLPNGPFFLFFLWKPPTNNGRSPTAAFQFSDPRGLVQTPSSPCLRDESGLEIRILPGITSSISTFYNMLITFQFFLAIIKVNFNCSLFPRASRDQHSLRWSSLQRLPSHSALQNWPVRCLGWCLKARYNINMMLICPSTANEMRGCPQESRKVVNC